MSHDRQIIQQASDDSRSVVLQSLLNDSSPNSAPIAYFYCARDASEIQRGDPDEVLRAILKQLSCQDSAKPIKPTIVKEYMTRKLDAEEDGLDPSKLSAAACADLIIALTEVTPAIIVIDALDECLPTRRYQILDALEKIRNYSSSVMKILVSSRDDADLKFRLQTYLDIEIRSTDNTHDISRFVSHELDTAIQDRRLLNGNVPPGLRERVGKKLMDNAKGMYVSPVFHSQR